nr:11094_t:CDS:2 [Entrophospora candida]
MKKYDNSNDGDDKKVEEVEGENVPDSQSGDLNNINSNRDFKPYRNINITSLRVIIGWDMNLKYQIQTMTYTVTKVS